MEGEVFAVNTVKAFNESLPAGFLIAAVISVRTKRTSVLQKFMKCNDNVLNNEYHAISQSLR